MMLKTAPGTKTTRTTRGDVVSRAVHHDAAARTSGPATRTRDDYRLSAAGYYEHLVEMFQGWHEHPEVVAGHWPATLEEAFGIAPRYDYPLSRADAEALADYFIDVYAPSRSARNHLRDFEGFIVDGPEYLTVFDGATGRELQTVGYKPGRHDDGLHVGRLRHGPDRAGQPGRPVPRRRGLPGRQAPVGGVRPRLLHPHHAGRLRLGRPAAARAAGTSTAAGRR